MLEQTTLGNFKRTVQIPAVTGDHIAPFTELQRLVVIELEVTKRIPDQISQLPELFAVAYP